MRKSLIALIAGIVLLFTTVMWVTAERSLDDVTAEKGELQTDYVILQGSYKAEKKTHQDTAKAYSEAVQTSAELQKQNEEKQARIAELERQLKAARASRSQSGSRTVLASRKPAYGQWANLINQYPWPRDVAYRIMMCESGGDANAYNPRSGATGLFQILHGPFDPAANVALAFQMWQKRGWQPWVCK